MGKLDSNFLFQKIREFEGFCVNDLYIFSNTCTKVNIIDDIVNGSFISTYKLLIQALTGEREGRRDLKIPNSDTILTLLVYLKKIYPVEEFYHIIKHLSEIYKHPNFKKKVQWIHKSAQSTLTLEQALDYIIFLKDGHCRGNIILIKAKAQKENNKVIPAFLRNKLPNINKNPQPPFVPHIAPVNNNYGYQPPVPQPLKNGGMFNNIGNPMHPPQPIQNVMMVNNNFIYPPQIPYNQYYGYQPPVPQLNQNLGINNNNYGYQAPMPQLEYDARVGNNNLYPAPIPHIEVQKENLENNNIFQPRELQEPINNIDELLQVIDKIDDQIDKKNLPDNGKISELEKELALSTQDGRTNFNSKPLIPSFYNIQEIRDFYNIRPNGVVSIENLEQAKKNAKRFTENLLPNNFSINVLYPKRAEIKEIPNIKLGENIDDWDNIDRNMRLYITIRNKAKELNIQKFLTLEERNRVERNMIDIQRISQSRGQIFSAVREMIQKNQFKCYFFNNNSAAIHIENGYLTDKKIYQGYVDRDGTPNYDGIQIQERLDTYDAIYSQAYNLAIELQGDKLISFFKAFSGAQCLDARVYPLQILLSEMQRDKELIISAKTAGSELNKFEAFESKFLEEYRKGIEKDQIIKNMNEAFEDRIFNNELVKNSEIINFVNEKYRQIGL